MFRTLEESEAIQGMDEILGYDRELEMYRRWMVLPQARQGIKVIDEKV